MAFRRSLKQAIRCYGTSNKGDDNGLYVAAAAGFSAIAMLQFKRMYEKKYNCDVGFLALVQGRWGEPFPDRNTDSNNDPASNSD